MNAIDLAKRALVKLLKEMAAIYTLTLSVARDSPDPAVRTAYRKVSVKAHPDRGGDADHQRQLNAAYSAWEAAAKAKQAHGGCVCARVRGWCACVNVCVCVRACARASARGVQARKAKTESLEETRAPL